MKSSACIFSEWIHTLLSRGPSFHTLPKSNRTHTVSCYWVYYHSSLCANPRAIETNWSSTMSCVLTSRAPVAFKLRGLEVRERLICLVLSRSIGNDWKLVFCAKVFALLESLHGSLERSAEIPSTVHTWCVWHLLRHEGIIQASHRDSAEIDQLSLSVLSKPCVADYVIGSLGQSTCQDLQSKFDVAKIYRDHINQVGADRDLEDYLQVSWPWFHPKENYHHHYCSQFTKHSGFP